MSAEKGLGCWAHDVFIFWCYQVLVKCLLIPMVNWVWNHTMIYDAWGPTSKLENTRLSRHGFLWEDERKHESGCCRCLSFCKAVVSQKPIWCRWPWSRTGKKRKRLTKRKKKSGKKKSMSLCKIPDGKEEKRLTKRKKKSGKKKSMSLWKEEMKSITRKWYGTYRGDEAWKGGEKKKKKKKKKKKLDKWWALSPC